ncbi:IS110 family transposase [Erysipelothrix rhusiopathiae]|nr:IS110 family transposase [Erysipelothrix rhusiopathiae]MDE8080797.1 IS110 family transposase [Erysipelothrix rhusiopathiae]MDE8084944.1 IS110 family transposase [Erysipelothrix rhusiopathiae]MDE8088011.1 IS110 family transposase [Erysipelothrix rhusiopathiae]MDE8095258.1 IS110 family transposase [Erysipelothrix rhusiopathiae]
MSFENKRSCIAIDVSKGISHFQGFYSAGVPASEATSFEHTKSGFSKVTDLFHFLKEQNDQKPFIIFEHTGTYSRPIEVYCKSNNFSYMAIPPLLSAKIRKSDIRPTKTDKIDCATIANVYYLKRLRVTKSNTKVYTDLKTLCSYYNFKVQLMVQMKVKYREHLDLVYPRIDTLFGVYTNTFLDLMTRYPNPHKLNKKSKKQLTEFFIKRDYCGLPKAQRLAILVKEYFKDIEIPVTEDDVLITIFWNHLKELRTIMKEVDDLLERIITLGMKTKEYPYLMSIPGIQKNTAARIAAEIQGIERFESASKLCAYAGIDPTVHSSGNYLGEHLSITKKGNHWLRCLLYLVVAGTSKSKAPNNPVRDFVQKKKSTV